jgi:hypothetical protein
MSGTPGRQKWAQSEEASSRIKDSGEVSKISKFRSFLLFRFAVVRSKIIDLAMLFISGMTRESGL